MERRREREGRKSEGSNASRAGHTRTDGRDTVAVGLALGMQTRVERGGKGERIGQRSRFAREIQTEREQWKEEERSEEGGTERAAAGARGAGKKASSSVSWSVATAAMTTATTVTAKAVGASAVRC